MIEEFSTELIDKINKGPWAVAKWPYNGGPFAAIVSMKLLSDTVMLIGWHEHTNDWNPYFQFTLKDGSSIETATPHITIPEWNDNKVYGLDFESPEIYVEVDDRTHDEPISKALLVTDIETVEFIGG